MINFKKVINFAITLIIMTALFLNGIIYGAVLVHRSSLLRIPLATDTRKRLLEVVKIAALAQSQKIYGNPYDNPDQVELYATVMKYLGIRSGVGVDVGASTNDYPAKGLLKGLDKVYMVDSEYGPEEVVIEQNIIKRKGLAEELPFPDMSCRVVVFNESLYFIGRENVLYSLKEAYRILQPDGWILIKPNSWPDPRRLYAGPSHFFEYTWDREVLPYRRLLEHAGFKDIMIFETATPFAFARAYPSIDLPEAVFIIARKPHNNPLRQLNFPERQTL